MDFINSLPDELLLMIFEFFTWTHVQKNCVLVSKKWFNLIRNDTKLSGKLMLSDAFSRKIFSDKNEKIKFHTDYFSKKLAKIKDSYVTK